MTDKKGINIIVWSKDRPTQLHLCLESLLANFKDAKESTIAVVYRATSEKFVKAYDSVRSIWNEVELSGGPKINFMYDTNFVLATNMSFGYHEQTMFVVDDQVFCDTFSTSDKPFEMLRSSPEKYFAVSLRLDPTKNYCYPANQKQNVSNFIIESDEAITWAWDKKEFDWGYVASLDGNVYHTNPVRSLINRFPPHELKNPNNLEMILNAVSQQGAVIYPPQLVCYPKAKTVSVPVNKVQTVFDNRTENTFTPEDLLNKWNEGFKIDVEDAMNKLKNTNSPHTPIEYTFVTR